MVVRGLQGLGFGGGSGCLFMEVFHDRSNHQEQTLYERGTRSTGKLHMFLATVADAVTTKL